MCYNGFMKKSDMILAGAVFGIAGAMLCLQGMGKDAEESGMAVVYQGRDRIAAYPLSEERTEEFLSPDGGRNILVISAGEAYMQDADCPDRLCVEQGRISRTGQTLTCLPHRLLVTIEEGEAAGLDGVTG